MEVEAIIKLFIRGDRNGNLASTSASQTNTWDYRNRLLTATKSGTSTTYLYDVNEQRVQKTVGGKVTRYPSQNYETVGTSTTKHIYANGTLVSTVEGVGSTSASVFHNHQDHLGSTAAVTSDIGYLTRLYNYYPYGTLRLDEGSTTTSFTQSNQFIGQNRDAEADLSYLNARYYSSNNGQFTSQDPVFRAVGNRDDITELTTVDQNDYLKNPQSFNSYSYSVNNPIRYSDPKGLWYIEASFTAQSGPFSGSYGLRVDGAGVDGFYSAGGGVGYFTGFGLGISSGALSHESDLSVSRNVSGAYGAGLQFSREGEFDPTRPLGNGKKPAVTVSIIAGIGGGFSQNYTRSQPLYIRSGYSNSNSYKSSTNQSSNKKSSKNYTTTSHSLALSNLERQIKDLQRQVDKLTKEKAKKK